jgi:hypothetical protein
MRRVYKNLCPATISASIMAANMLKNSLKNVESANNKILYKTLLNFFLQWNGTFWISLVYLNSISLYAAHNHEVKYMLIFIMIQLDIMFILIKTVLPLTFTHYKQSYLLAYHSNRQLQIMKMVGLSEHLIFKKLFQHIPELIKRTTITICTIIWVQYVPDINQGIAHTAFAQAYTQLWN